MANSESSILEMEVTVNNIVKDLRNRIQIVFDKYTTDSKKIPKLPDFDDLVKSNRLHYETSRRLTECIDELMDVKLRVNLVRKKLGELQNIQSTSRSEYSFMCNFKNNLANYDEELAGYRFELADLIKNCNNKLRILESVSFYEEV